MPDTLRVIFCFLVFASSAVALEKPVEVAKVIHADAPYGQANYRAMFMNIYDAYLWSDSNAWGAEKPNPFYPEPWGWQKPFALTLIYHMGFSSDDLSNKSIEEMKQSAGITAEQQSEYRTLLSRFLPSVKDGDRITALYMPHLSLQFFHNGKETGSSSNMEFAKAFLGIWLSEKTSNPAFRKKLIAGRSSE